MDPAHIDMHLQQIKGLKKLIVQRLIANDSPKNALVAGDQVRELDITKDGDWVLHTQGRHNLGPTPDPDRLLYHFAVATDHDFFEQSVLQALLASLSPNNLTYHRWLTDYMDNNRDRLLHLLIQALEKTLDST